MFIGGRSPFDTLSMFGSLAPYAALTPLGIAGRIQADLRSITERNIAAEMGKPTKPRNAPIPVDVMNRDAGVKVTKRKVGDTVELTFKGVARGVYTVDRPTGHYSPEIKYGSVSLGVAIDEAPVTDLRGRTNYTEKNRRFMNHTTKQGQTAVDLAKLFEKDINGNLRAFRAKVVPGNAANIAKLILTRL